ncbi:hypothetical protein RM704_26435 [Streptomyces sp. DSM 3412]|uniref:Uncharacterized protein n=1 Tax=Streptomyces gottesmaniae TaxID=3075518 RepID=A0ABU2Z2Z7_9ACTN|nr:hypothetical protein [Streptomyces sp. DSM 3412]MDT0570957.1 hypothetical protein [Streptomyces sp. DSM 3412]
MNIRTRSASTSAAAVLLLCFTTVGTATAADAPPGESVVASEDDTTEINDRQDWEDETEQPVLDREPQRCEMSGTWIKITSKQAYHIPSWWNGTSYKDGPGGTMTVSVTKSGTITAEVSTTAEVEASMVVASAKSSISYKISGSATITTGHTYSRTISSNKKYGHMRYGSWGYKVKWKQYRAKSNGCGATQIGSGTATLPTKETGWKYWETSS